MRLFKRLQHAFRTASLKTKLIFMMTSVTLISLIFSGVFILSYEIARAKKVSVQDMLTLSEITASTSTAALVFLDRKSINEYLSSLSRRSDVIAACIYSENQQIFGKYTRDGSRLDCPARPGRDGHAFEKGPVLQLFQPIEFERRRIGTIYIASDLGYLRHELVFQATLVGSALFAAVALALIFSGWIQRYFASPILSLAQTARIISKKKDYSIRVSTVRHDEIGYLIEAFNSMLAQIERQNTELRNSTQILESILNSMGDGVVVVDSDENVLVWNAAAQEILGPAKIPDRKKWIWSYDFYLPDIKTHYPSSRLPLTRAMHGELVDQEELYFKRPEKETRCISVTARPLITSAEHIRGGVSVFRDVTEKKHLEAERERLLREAQEAIRLRDEFMSIASHELKTPLTPLRTQVQMLQRLSKTGALQQYPPEKLQKLMSFTDRQVKRLVSLIEDLLDVTRITSGKLHLHLEDMEVEPMIREVLEQHEQDIERSGSKILTDLDGAINTHWDRFRIEQVIANLLTNALKYGQGKEITITARLQNDIVIITMRDLGIGISDEAQKRIFARFERAVPMAHYGGLGLGLYISRQIVLAHGGSIRVESKLGQGSVFTVELPRIVQAESGMAS